MISVFNDHIEHNGTTCTMADAVFREFADNHPHAAHESDPDKFWEYFHKIFPNLSRSEMIQLLLDTEEKGES